MANYLIAKISITDREEYELYEAGFIEIFSAYKGKMLAVDESVKLLEGEWPVTRTVLIEFPSEEDAMDWYTSEEYQKLAKHRFASSQGDIVLVHGIEPIEER